MPEFEVEVEVKNRQVWIVEAEDWDEAAKIWGNGRCVVDEHLETLDVVDCQEVS